MATRDPALDGTSVSVDHLRTKSETLGKLGDAKVAKATILSGAAFVDIQFPADHNDRPAFASLQGVDGTLFNIRHSVWQGAGVLRVSGNANATADVAVVAMVVQVLT